MKKISDKLTPYKKTVEAKFNDSVAKSTKLVDKHIKNYKENTHPKVMLRLAKLYKKIEPTLRPLIEYLTPYYYKAKSYFHFHQANIQNHPNYELISKFLFAKTLEDSGYHSNSNNTVKTAITPYIKLFKYVMIVFCLFFFVWGGLAPLDQAIVAQGSIILAGKRKEIQYDHAGIVKSINVEDGQMVKEGDILLTIDDTSFKADLEIIKSRLVAFNVAEYRILSQLKALPAINWQAANFDLKDQETIRAIQTQDNIFRTRSAIYTSSRQIKLEQIKIKQDEITLNKSLLEIVISQSKTLKQEVEDLNILQEKGLVRRNTQYEMQRRREEAVAKEIEIRNKISSTEQIIKAAELEVLNLDNEYQSKLAEEYREAHGQVLDLKQKYSQQNFIVKHSIIRAPVSGIVANLAYHTIGGFVGQGAKVLDIVPQDDKLVVEAHVKIQDIDSVVAGQLARVQLGAYKQRLVPRIDGKVIYVAADSKQDQGSPEGPYYLVRIEIPDSEIAKVNLEIKLQPGMPVSVFIVKGERTFLGYMVSPILDSFHRAFKEQ